MISELSKYGAVSTKVRAMYGRMLSPEDWQRVGECRDMRGFTALLRSMPGTAGAAAGLPAGDVAAAEVIRALRAQVDSEYESLFRFASQEDKQYLIFQLHRAEYRLILAAIRRVLSYRTLPPEEGFSEFFRQKSRLDLDALLAARSFPEIISASERSIFAGVLSDLRVSPETGAPDYADAGVLLENRYYAAVWAYLKRKRKDDPELIRSLGTEADLLNISNLIRLRLRFPASLRRYGELLIPIRYHLRESFISQLAEAPSDEAFMALMRASRWSGSFPELDPALAQRKYEESLAAFCRRQIHSVTPGICVPQAYLTLRSLECSRLVRAAEAASYGISPASVI